MAHPDPDRRRQIAAMASHTSWARTPHRAERTLPARRASEGRFEKQVDPDGVMDPAERAKAAESAMRADRRAMAKKRWDKVRAEQAAAKRAA